MAPNLERIRKTAYRVLESPKMTVVMPYAPERGNWFDIVVYPKPEHEEAFLKAITGLKPGGPSKDYPGAVGTVRVTLTSKGDLAVLQIAQSHFKKGNGAGFLSPTLARKYSGWRQRALEHLIRTIVMENGYKLFISKAVIRDLPYRSVEDMAKTAPIEGEIRKAAKLAGAKHEEGEFTYEISRG
ncbi:Uncharacterised protein [Candidatus Norongarragalina meridionalis]|nr:Uncharacterised protein [Candidatus Norongarragalina meridionalis]